MRKKICSMMFNEKLSNEFKYSSSKEEYLKDYIRNNSRVLESIACSFELNNIGIGVEASSQNIKFTFIAESFRDFDEEEIAKELANSFNGDLILIDVEPMDRLDCTDDIDEDFKFDIIDEYLDDLHSQLDLTSDDKKFKEILAKIERIEEYYEI